jgi:hypothetical protein
MYAASATIPTNIKGIHTFPAAPSGFDPLQAEDMDLARYGYPVRPDPQADPDSYARWAKAVKAMKIAPDPNKLREMPYGSQPMIHGPASMDTAGISGTPSTSTSSNWSGIANTNKNTKYIKNTSFYFINSDFNTPVAQQARGACDGGYDIEVSWNGIDGFTNGTVVQGGSLSQAYCSGGTTTPYYCDWIEWFPSYNIICVITPPTPGDDVFVQTQNYGGTAQQIVCVIDETLNTGGCYGLTWVSGPGLIGKSAEYIVERPGCGGSCLYPLANYIWDFWSNSLAYDYINYADHQVTPFYPGATTPTTYIITMYNNAFTIPISVASAQGKYGIFFNDENCALSGGC